MTPNNTSHWLITLQCNKVLSFHAVHMWILPDKFNCCSASSFLDDVLSCSPWVCFGLVFKHRQCSTASSRPPGILPSECPPSVKILIILLYRAEMLDFCKRACKTAKCFGEESRSILSGKTSIDFHGSLVGVRTESRLQDLAHYQSQQMTGESWCLTHVLGRKQLGSGTIFKTSHTVVQAL